MKNRILFVFSIPHPTSGAGISITIEDNSCLKTEIETNTCYLLHIKGGKGVRFRIHLFIFDRI